MAGAVSLLAACVAPTPDSTGRDGGQPTGLPMPTEGATTAAGGPTVVPTPASPQAGARSGESAEALTPYETVTNYNNYYEFTHAKEGVAGVANRFQAAPWQVEVGGLVHRARTFGLEDLLKMFPSEERIYRLRCVEAWSMFIPWQGFPLSRLLAEVEPTADARFVRFETVYRPEEMPGQVNSTYPWPYQEGLRLDEALHPLTILATGVYGAPLPAQNGAPVRLVVPWKYGFKSIKSIVKIELVAEQPATLWSTLAPSEYGFYANVNPDTPHPRWSQSRERQLGESGWRDTLAFNGYGEAVASLYTGMDLRENF